MRTFIHAGLCTALAFTIVAGPLQQAATAGQPSARIAQAQSTGTLTGTVVDARNQPQSGAQVNATGPSGTPSTTTDGNGQFSFTLTPGLYDIVVNKGGYQTNESPGIGVVAGSTTNLNITLSEFNLNTLKIIGRVTTRGGNVLNTRPTSVTTLSGEEILARVNPNLNDVVAELPGISIGRGTGATPNTNFIVRGSILETKTQIDGHQLSSGVFGEYNTNYAVSAIFDQVEVAKGVGLNGPNSGESPIGTVNLRTRDFSATSQGNIALGADSFGGTYYNLWTSGNFLKDNRFSYVLAKSFSGNRGQSFGYTGNRLGLVSPNATYNLNDSGAATSLIQWQGDMSYPYSLEGELVKLRYRLSSATSLQVQYLGLQGQYQPQGGSYASYSGNRTIAPCYTQTATGGFASNTDPTLCTPTSATGPFAQFNPPYISPNLIGQNAPVYSWFPNSVVQNNEPYFSAEFKTTLGNDTLLLRPYAAVINRFISGALENRYPGNGGGWYMVTNPANCQVRFSAPKASTGALAAGPCFQGGTTPYTATPAFVNPLPGGPNAVFNTTNTPLSCSVATPCWTTPTAQENDGLYGFGTPFSQPEVDRLRGITFQYLHPVKDNLYGFSYDYNSDDTIKLTGDTTTPPAGCALTVGNGSNAPGTIGYQPTCPLSFLPRTGLQIPPTQIRRGDFALTGLLQLSPQIQAGVGLYLTTWNAAYQIEDPALTALLGNAAPVSLIKQNRTLSHFDPQFGITWRPNKDLVLRASGGSGVTVPIAGNISGFPNVDLPNGANNNTYTLSPPNPLLQPETTIAYDGGGDLRLRDGGVLSIDYFNNTIHNVFLFNNIPGTPATLPGCPATAGVQCQTSLLINGPIERNYGVELTAQKVVPIGFGYTATGTIQRAYLDQLPASLYAFPGGSNLINLKQLDGNGSQIVPYFKAYAEARYGWVRGGLFSIGADWLGGNNSTYGPGFITYNATLREPINNGYAVQLAVQNLTNYNSGTFIGQATLNNGFSRSRLAPAVPGGPLVYSSTASSLQIVQPRTFRIEISKFLGRY